MSTGSRAKGTFWSGCAHRYALELALGRPLGIGMHTLHTCDNPACVRNDDEGVYEINGVVRIRRGHLVEGTTQDNTADSTAKNRRACGAQNGDYTHPERRPRGETQWLAKFTENQIREIRRRSMRGERAVNLAVEFGVADNTIYRIVTRKTWKHVL